MHRSALLVTAALAALSVAGAGGAAANEGWSYAATLDWIQGERFPTPTFQPGETLGRGDLPRMAPFVPPGFLPQLDFQGFVAEIQAPRTLVAHPLYESASLAYGRQTEIGADGRLLHYVAGRPFSAERVRDAPADRAAYQIAWNYIYRWQHYGYASDAVHFAFLRPGTATGRNADTDAALRGGGIVERHLIERFQRVYLSHLAVEAENDHQLDVEGAGSLHYKDYLSFTHPFEVRGNTFVIERSLDPLERDQVNSYLATERRVRRLSPKERADRFVGSEFTLDDFEGFSGRVLDYEWVYHGERDLLYVADVRGDHAVFFGPSSHVPWDRWQLRRCFVVEQRPHLSEHTYGRTLLFVDVETSIIAMKLMFDQRDQLLKVLYPLYRWPLRPEQVATAAPRETVPLFQANVAINVQTGASGVVWSVGTEIPDVKPSEVRRLFSVTNLSSGR